MAFLKGLFNRQFIRTIKDARNGQVLKLYQEYVDGILESYLEDYLNQSDKIIAEAVFSQQCRAFFDEILSGIEPLIQYGRISKNQFEFRQKMQNIAETALAKYRRSIINV